MAVDYKWSSTVLVPAVSVIKEDIVPTPEEKALKEKCENELARLGKERKRISREHTESFNLGEENPKLPPRWHEVSREMQRCHEVLVKLRMKARGNETVHTNEKGIKIVVTHSPPHLVQISGFPGSQINPHLRDIEPRQDELGILNVQTCRDILTVRRMGKTGRICKTITLKDYESLNKYLTVLGV
ncbi:hypothetical protein BH24ACT22_BH24ACT22_10680 [soil metagenome]